MLILLPFNHVNRTFQWYLAWFSSLFLHSLRQWWSIPPYFSYVWWLLRFPDSVKKLQNVLWAWCTNQSNFVQFFECTPLFILEICFLYSCFVLKKKKLYCPVYAKRCFKGFYWTKGNTWGNLRPIQSLNWKFTKGKWKCCCSYHSYAKYLGFLKDMVYNVW